MAKKPSRVKLSLDNLPPDSARRIFSFINILLNRYRLSVDCFKKSIPRFNPMEQYFICQYCNKYFTNEGSGIYLYKWLEQQQKAFADAGEYESYGKLDAEISFNQTRLLKILPSLIAISEKRAKDLLRYNISTVNYNSHFSDNAIDSRIPLFYNRKQFKDVFFNIWDELYTKDQIQEMYLNSFRFTLDDSRPRALFIDVSRKMDIYSKVATLIEQYNEHINRQSEKKALDYNSALHKISELRRSFTKQYNYESTIRLPFAYMMYNTFPQVRDSLQNKLLKDPNYSMDLYFENIIKNFSKRD